MAAQTLAKTGRASDEKQRPVDGAVCARKTGNQHAVSQMQTMLDEISEQE